MAGYLENPDVTGAPGRPPADAELRQTQDAARAGRAYADAAASVARLVRRYGEGTVLGWLAAGLPREVRNASSNAAATKSK